MIRRGATLIELLLVFPILGLVLAIAGRSTLSTLRAAGDARESLSRRAAIVRLADDFRRDVVDAGTVDASDDGRSIRLTPRDDAAPDRSMVYVATEDAVERRTGTGRDRRREHYRWMAPADVTIESDPVSGRVRMVIAVESTPKWTIEAWRRPTTESGGGGPGG